ncbi:MAG: C10 family peptidase [Prevotellaceae bacterium]|nr:C10 family peptidase [Prevotellaceae bacterium]
MKQLLLSRRTGLLLALFLSSSVVTVAAPRSLEQARREAVQVMRGSEVGNGHKGTVTTMADATPQLVYVKEKRGNDEAYYYVFSPKRGKGYAIVSGDDRMPAIVGYSTNGTYDADNLPPNMVSFMQAYEEFMDSATDEQLQQVTEERERVAAERTSVEPFIKTEWDQGMPYNGKCPEYVQGIKSVTGCVATAVAQILGKYRYPSALLADIPAYTTAYGIKMDEVKAGDIYDWDNMLDTYNGSETETQKEAVAKLMLHIGCAVKMNYGPSSSAAVTAELFTKYFGMDKELTRQVTRSSYDFATWDAILYKEMHEERPVLYDGQSAGGGHAFVVNGYKDGLYYVNWGWSGYCDGYFDITVLNPHNNSGIGASSTEDGYSSVNTMIIGIAPDNGVEDKREWASILSYEPLTMNGKVDKGVITGTVNITPLNSCLNGKTYVGVGYRDKDGNIVNVTSNPISFDSENYGHNSGRIAYLPVTLLISRQKQELFLIESDDQTVWTPCLNAVNTSLLVWVENGKLQTSNKVSSLSATVGLASENTEGTSGTNNSISVAVSNNSDKEFYNKVYVWVTDDATATPDNVTEFDYSSGMTVLEGETKALTFNYAPNKAGTYYFWVLANMESNSSKLTPIGSNSITFATSEAPILSIESIKCVNASGDKVYANYRSSLFEMDIIKSLKAEYVINIKNAGGAYSGEFVVYKDNYTQLSRLVEKRTLDIAANATSSFTYTLDGSIGDVYAISIQSTGANLAGMTDNLYNIMDVNGNSSVVCLPNFALCYFAGDPDNVNSVAVDGDVLTATGGAGCITLKANADTKVYIATAGGAFVRTVTMSAGEQTTVNLPAGMYIVNKNKVVVR